jgi:LacI family transcriptional regulator, xylobiose transport system transcriptional regulator
MTVGTQDDPAADRRGEPITFARIAQLAGVSVPTVSKVVNGRADVAAETRARVEAVIRRHGVLRQKRQAYTAAEVELVFHELEGAYAIQVIQGVERVVREQGMALVLSQLSALVPGRGWIESVLARRPTGVIMVFSGLTDAQHQQLRARRIPLVIVDPTGEPQHPVPSVGASNWSGGLTATRHLLDLGHRRIATITGALQVLSGRARLDGYRAAMDMAGIPVDPALVREGDFHVEDGLVHGRALLGLPDPPTAILTGNDVQAFGVYQAASEAGLRVPDDLSVVGFDDLPMTQWTSPPLTTIHQPLADMAETAATMVLTLARELPLSPTRVELATRLVIRSSTAPPVR